MTFFWSEPPAPFRQKYRIEDSTSYDIETRRRHRRFSPGAVQRCLYRPFDVRWLYYDVGLTSRPAEKVMRHFLAGQNVGLITTRQTKDDFAALATTLLAGHKSCAGYDINTVFPLYLYPDGEAGIQGELVPHENGRRPNLAAEFVRELERRLGWRFVPEGRGDLKRTFGPEDVFNYAYAIFHAPSYRRRYAEFLKLDFPRLPLTSDALLFRRLCGCGARLLSLHTLREPGLEMVSFDQPGDNIVTQVVFVPPTGRVHINPKQYFEGVLPVVWKFYIGGYQVCAKWLEDRKGRALDHDDIECYPRIVSALSETRTQMAQIDSLISDHGNWPLR
jgi:hypothetical protein